MQIQRGMFAAGAILTCLWGVSSVSSQTSQPPSDPTPSTQAIEPEVQADADLRNVTPPTSTAPPTQRFVMPPPPPRVDPDAYKMSSSVDVVLLDVSVKNDDGGFVSGLKKEDFQVLEDDVKQPITIFAAADVPVTVGLVVDNSGSVRPKKPEIVTAALTFVT